MENEDKVKVEICCGTACYLLGAMRLMDLTENLPKDLVGLVEFEAKACLGKCERDEIGCAPYVRFNGTEWMGNATPERVVERIRELAGRREEI
ncbi:MAG: NAD(P)H-dependent oxidoreductase subunit E [Kiritimatiellae bacterium]|nr:NAD(P)H-dependent oxidoreductase subunit E [Kiritimatiellia bacterium]